MRPDGRWCDESGAFGISLTANQITFVNLNVHYLTLHGVMEAARLYESPFTEIAAQGPEAVFPSNKVDELIIVLQRVRAAATG